MSDNRYYVNYGAADPSGFLAVNGTYLQSSAASIAIGWITDGTNSFATSQVLVTDISRQAARLGALERTRDGQLFRHRWLDWNPDRIPGGGASSPVSLQSETENGSYIVSSQGYTLFEVCGNSVARRLCRSLHLVLA
jgi:hypothetical protein